MDALAQASQILVIKPDEIGDFVLCSPFLRGLRASAPTAIIWLAVQPAVHDLAVGCPYVDRVILTHIRAREAQVDLRLDAGVHTAELQDLVQDKRFDLTVVPRFEFDRYGAGQLAAWSGAQRVVGFGEACTSLKALRNKGFDRFYTDVLVRPAEAHEVEHNLALLSYLGGTPDGDYVEVWSRPADQEHAAELAEAAGLAEHFIAVAPFTNASHKEMPFELLAPIVADAAGTLAADIAIIGAASDSDRAQKLAAMLPGRAFNACGVLTLGEAAALIQRAAALIGMDSGPAHIAAASGIPVAVFSCHSVMGDPAHYHAPQRFRPWAPPEMVRVIQPAAPVAPCTFTCAIPAPHCIIAIDADAARERVSAFLRTAAPALAG